MSAVLPESPAPVPADEEEAKPMSAAQRLAESREQMRQWMTQADGRSAARRRAAAAMAEGESPAWMDKLRGAPVIGVVIQAVSAWWADHPLRPATDVAESVIRDAVGPVARRHPVSTVLVAALVGAAVVRFRPWRWIVTPALFAGLTSQLVTRFVAEMPFDSLLNALYSFSDRHRDDSAPREDAVTGDDMPQPAPETTPEARPTVH
jgi:hypothetical protein